MDSVAGISKEGNSISPPVVAKLFNQQNPVQSIWNATSIGFKQIVEFQIEKVDVSQHGGQFIQAAICYQKEDLLKLFFEKGCSIDNVPKAVQPVPEDVSKVKSEEYREAPFLVQAAKTGNLQIFKLVED